MIENTFVIDAVIHGFNFLPENYNADFLPDLTQMLYHGAHVGFQPSDGRYNMTWTEFLEMFRHQPEITLETIFGESQVDAFVYHGVPLEGFYKDGSSPIWVAKKARARLPHRVFIYGPIYPWQDGAAEEVDRLVDEDGVIGLKFYPVDLIDGRLKASRLDSEGAFKVIDRAQARGLKNIAVHKAVPLGPLPLEPFATMYDLAPAIEAFPDMTFEIVHGGAAFLPETVALLEKYPNVVINLESLPCFIHHPEMVKTWRELTRAFIAAGAADRVFYASGALGMHPQSCLEGFWNDTSVPELTSEIKQNWLGKNYARMMGWNLETMRAKNTQDEFGIRTENGAKIAGPWSWLRSQPTLEKQAAD
jgi:uncharacterized protein